HEGQERRRRCGCDLQRAGGARQQRRQVQQRRPGRDQVHLLWWHEHARAHREQARRPPLAAVRGRAQTRALSQLTACFQGPNGCRVRWRERRSRGASMIRYRIALARLAAACAPLAGALPAGAEQATSKVTTITVTAGKPAEFRFTLSKKTAPHGIVIFKITNKGLLPHDFKIAGRKTKLISPGQSN